MITNLNCDGCIWEDACRADEPGCTRCGDFCNAVTEFTYQLLSYNIDVIERVAEYTTIIEEQQR